MASFNKFQDFGDQISIYLHPANVGGATMWTQNFRIKAGYPVTETVLLA